jgi:hypothetical protein
MVFNVQICVFFNCTCRENIIVLQGYHHKCLKYLEKETKFVALGTHALCHRWLDNHIMMVLSLFGRREDFDDIFDRLDVWR